MDDEMKNTLYEVAKMKAEFALLKQAILNNLVLDYSGEELTLRNDRLIIEVMYLLADDEMCNILAHEKMVKAEKDAKKQEASNG